MGLDLLVLRVTSLANKTCEASLHHTQKKAADWQTSTSEVQILYCTHGKHIMETPMLHLNSALPHTWRQMWLAATGSCRFCRLPTQWSEETTAHAISSFVKHAGSLSAQTTTYQRQLLEFIDMVDVNYGVNK